MMKYMKIVTFLVICIVVFSTAAALVGIFSSGGPGTYEYETIRGDVIEIYGKGIYQHMESEVAIQGIAQDYITLSIGVPLLLVGLFKARKGSLRGRFLLTGTLGYFLLTYLFYLLMAMYNTLFLLYVFLMGASFFALILMLMSFDIEKLKDNFGDSTPHKFPGIFLIVNGLNIAFLWLSTIVPPLLDGTIYPKALGHSTTLVVQGMDLGLMLPFSVVSGILLLKKSNFGYLFAPVYLIFLSILMAALTAKLIAMGMAGVSIIPAIFMIPGTMMLAIICAVILLRNLKYASIANQKTSS